MARDARRTLGALGEAAASAWLTAHGYEVLDRNVRTRSGEIDLVARCHDLVVFVEVKSRSGTGFGHPGEAVAAVKQRRLARLASAYLTARGWHGCLTRFDVITVLTGASGRVLRIEHVPDAFRVAI
ncbi:MAG: YraN family protein [Armatimonadota bacterium]|nr:YraN family protein [Armatimonadota bacterium]